MMSQKIQNITLKQHKERPLYVFKVTFVDGDEYRYYMREFPICGTVRGLSQTLHLIANELNEQCKTEEHK